MPSVSASPSQSPLAAAAGGRCVAGRSLGRGGGVGWGCGCGESAAGFAPSVSASESHGSLGVWSGMVSYGSGSDKTGCGRRGHVSRQNTPSRAKPGRRAAPNRYFPVRGVALAGQRRILRRHTRRVPRSVMAARAGSTGSCCRCRPPRRAVGRGWPSSAATGRPDTRPRSPRRSTPKEGTSMRPPGRRS